MCQLGSSKFYQVEKNKTIVAVAVDGEEGMPAAATHNTARQSKAAKQERVPS